MRGPVARGIATRAAVAATAAIYLLVFREDSDSGRRDRDAGRAEVPKAVRDLVGELTAEQKVDGILLMGFEGTDSTAPFLDELRARQLGGLLVREENWLDAVQGPALIGELKAAATEDGEIPPLVAAAQEGGEYRSFDDLPPENRQLNIGDSGDPELAESWAFEAGEALREAGFDMNLAPIADVATLDSPLADRAFSDDELITSQLTAAAIRGCEEAGIACVARHFPGLGAASQSTDQGPATVSLDAETLASRDLAPFEAAVAEGAPAVMLSHAFYAAYDPVTPGSLTETIATELLRDGVGFTGVAMTDDLSTGAIRGTSGVATAAVEAVNAGADMLLVSSPDEAANVREALLGAADSEEIPADRLDQAVGRVLELKRRYGLLEE